MKKILVIVGTRPEAIKLIPLYLSLKEEFDVQLISSGQHREMLAPIFAFFEVTPDRQLDTMIPNQSLSEITAALFIALNDVLGESKADLVVVQGDTTTAMVAAMVAYYHKIPVAHVEAGLRSHDIHAPFPEEVNRRTITQIAELHFAPTLCAAKNLSGVENVHVVGNTIVDSLYLALAKVEKHSYRDRFSFLADDKDIILVTVHRRESFGEGLSNICEAIRILAARHPCLKFVYPVHMNPNVSTPVNRSLGNIPSVFLIEPVRYDEMVCLMTKVRLILTDSGGVQEEGPALNVPVIVLRDVTERPEGIEAGCAVLAGTSTERIVSAFEEIYFDAERYKAMSLAPNPYGDGKSAARITDVVRSFL